MHFDIKNRNPVLTFFSRSLGSSKKTYSCENFSFLVYEICFVSTPSNKAESAIHFWLQWRTKLFCCQVFLHFYLHWNEWILSDSERLFVFFFFDVQFHTTYLQARIGQSISFFSSIRGKSSSQDSWVNYVLNTLLGIDASYWDCTYVE